MDTFFRLESKTATERRDIEINGCSLAELESRFKAASVGLTDPYISLSIEVEDWPHEGEVAAAQVVGTRPMTDDEVTQEIDRQRLAERQREYMRGMPT